MGGLMIAAGVMRFKLIGLLFILALGGPVSANEESELDALFTIRRVGVDVTAASAAVARTRALEQAESKAFDLLIAKLTQPEDRENLPALSRTERLNLIRGIEVVEEKSSTRRYVAYLNVAFEPSLVSRFFADYGVPHIFSAGAGLLVFHVHRRGPVITFWEKDPVIDAAREDVDWVNRLRIYDWATGSLSERVTLTADQVTHFDGEASLTLAQQYGREAALLLVTDWDASLGVLTYEAALMPVGVRFQGGFDTGTAPQREKAGLMAAYNEILEAVDADWRSKLLVDVSLAASIDVDVPSMALDHWLDIQTRLDRVSLIRRTETLLLGLPISQIRIHYTGLEEQLLLALNEVGLTVEEDGAGYRLTLLGQGDKNG